MYDLGEEDAYNSKDNKDQYSLKAKAGENNLKTDECSLEERMSHSIKKEVL